jgi:hypothetical protein
MSRTPIKLEDHHPEMMKYSAQTRRLINAYNGHGIAGSRVAGWDAVDVELKDILAGRTA